MVGRLTAASDVSYGVGWCDPSSRQYVPFIETATASPATRVVAVVQKAAASSRSILLQDKESNF